MRLGLMSKLYSAIDYGNYIFNSRIANNINLLICCTFFYRSGIQTIRYDLPDTIVIKYFNVLFD